MDYVGDRAPLVSDGRIPLEEANPNHDKPVEYSLHLLSSQCLCVLHDYHTHVI